MKCSHELPPLLLPPLLPPVFLPTRRQINKDRTGAKYVLIKKI